MSYTKLHEYNGWTNKPTWLVHLWLTNEQQEQEHWFQMAGKFLEENEDTEDAIYEFSEELKNQVELGAPEQASMYTDLLSFSIAYVNWVEIAKVFIDDVLENDLESVDY